MSKEVGGGATRGAGMSIGSGARPKKPKNVIKVNSNPVPTPVKTNTYVEKPSSQSKYDWSDHRWNAKEGTGPYGEPTFNKNAKVPPIKVNTNPVPGKTVIGPLARQINAKRLMQ